MKLTAAFTMTGNHPLSCVRLIPGSMGPGIIRLLRLAARPRVAALALAATLGCVSYQAFAQSVQGGTGTAQTQAVILDPGSIAKKSDMDFGSVAQTTLGGTIAMSAASTAACTATGGLIHAGACKAAAFTIRGKRNERVRIRDNNAGVVTLNGPAGATMTMDTMTIGVSGMSASGNGQGWDFGNWQITDAGGITDFYVGGTLHIGAAQTPGVYHGTLLIQIQFN